MSPSDTASRLRSALALHQAGRLDEAEAIYREILTAEPTHLDALHLLCTLRLQQGRFEDALTLADQVIELAPDAADAYGNKGSALQALERPGEAAFALRHAIARAPDGAHLHYNLGNALRMSGDKNGAVAAYREAVRLAPALAPAHSNLGATLAELGLFDAAAEHCRAAIRHAADYPEAHYNLGNALREQGLFDDAADSYRRAIALKPDHANAYCNLGLTLIQAGELAPAIATLGKALTADAGHEMARFYQAVAMEMSGQDAGKAFAALNTADFVVAAWLDSWDYIKSHSDLRTQILHDTFALLTAAMGEAAIDGLVLEFGVRHGQSIRHLAGLTAGPVHGFDSFAGLPSAWGDEPAGVYSTGGQMPDVPANVSLHAGLFEDTLAPFLAAHPGPVRFCNIDCDLHTSAVTVLHGLAPRIVPGTVLVFDEYLVNPTWREDEYRAFQEAVQTFGWRYRYIAFGIITKQAAVIIESVPAIA